MPSETVTTIVCLLQLDDDILAHIMAFAHDVCDVAAFCACSTHSSFLVGSNALWKTLTNTTWPHLPEAEVECGSMPWRDVYRSRALSLPEWRHYLVRMDEVEYLLTNLTSGFESECDRLATQLIAIFCSSEHMRRSPSSFASSIISYTYGRRFCQRLCYLAMRPPARQALCEWSSTILILLDDFYDAGHQRDHLQAIVLRSLRCASALVILRDEVGAYTESVDGEPNLHDISPERVEEALLSLEMEGFDVSVAPSLKPTTLPPSGHGWWHAQTRQGYLGGVTNIR